MTWQAFLDDIRTGLADPDKVAWPDPALLTLVNNTRNELYGLHPEAFYVSSVVVALPADPTDASLTSAIDFLPTWAEAIKAHVRWQAYMEDSDERQNMALADHYFAVWAKKVGV